MKMSRLLLCFLCFALTIISSAQDDDLPVVAILKFGELRPFELSQQGILDVFEAYGYVDGENVEFIIGEASFDIAATETLIADALSNDVDIIIAVTTPVAVTATRLTSEMEDPPIIFFNVVTNPFAAGIVDSPCVKPDHVTGTAYLTPLDIVFPMMLEVDADIETVGVIYNDEEANSVASVAWLEEISEDIGINLFPQAVNSSDVVRATAEAMIMAGVDAFFVTTDSTVTNALVDVSETAALAGIPVFGADASHVYSDATFGIGLGTYEAGVASGRLAVAYLNGELDVARTMVNRQEDLIIGVNLDVAISQNVEIPEAFLDTVDFVIEDGESTEDEPSLEVMSLEERQVLDAEFIETLYCTDEMIAEQQAELDD